MAFHHRLTSTPLPFRIAGLYVATALLIAGLVAFMAPAQNQTVVAERRVQLAQQAESISTKEEIGGTPVRLVVDRLGVDVSVKNGTYNDVTNQWTLSETDAFFATVSDEPRNRPGSTFIYGHNRPAAFGPLQAINVGDTVSVTTDSGAVLTYTYREDAVVAPEFTDVLYEESEVPQLILMTCEGLWSEVRRDMYFTLSEATA